MRSQFQISPEHQVCSGSSIWLGPFLVWGANVLCTSEKLRTSAKRQVPSGRKRTRSKSCAAPFQNAAKPFQLTWEWQFPKYTNGFQPSVSLRHSNLTLSEPNVVEKATSYNSVRISMELINWHSGRKCGATLGHQPIENASTSSITSSSCLTNIP